MKLAVLAGGTGAAKFLRGLVPLVDPSDLTIAFNNKPTNQDACKGATMKPTRSAGAIDFENEPM